MTAYNLTDQIQIAKRLYPDGLMSMLLKKSPFFGLVKKWTKFGGRGKHLAWKVAPGNGGSVDFSTAQANKQGGIIADPFITRVKEYGLASVDREAKKATMGDANAMAELYKVAMDDCRYNCSRSMAISIWGNGTGERGRVSSTATIASATLLMTTASESNTTSGSKFERNMWVQAMDPATLTVRAGRAQLSGITRATGAVALVTAGGNWSAQIPAIATGDIIIRQGDGNAGVLGVPRWIPDADPLTGDPAATRDIGGIDRSPDPRRYAGGRYSPTGGNYEELFTDFAARLNDELGATPDKVITDPITWGNFVKQVGSKRIVPVETKIPGIGYKALEIEGIGGTMQVLPEYNCPRKHAYFLTMDTWEIWSLGDLIEVLTDDESVTEPNADAEEIRFGGYWNNVCWDPSQNGVLVLPS